MIVDAILRFRRKLALPVCGLVIFQLLFPPVFAFAQVSGGAVVAGNATVNVDGSTVNVNSLTDRTIINWQGFSIGVGETVNFLQPDPSSAVLNRVVTPGNPSTIFGALNSNGNVLLVNPSGILVGPGGVINTNGFTASVLDLPNHEFLQGGSLTFRGSSTASVINQGEIHTGTGGAALIGGNIINEGTITSAGGSISLATGGTVTLDDGSRFTHADLATIESGISPYASLIKNSGTIRATGAIEAGGEVYLVNPGGKIMHDGTIAVQRSTSGGNDGGVVSIDASQGGTATVSGNIDAAGDQGGRVIVEADEIELIGAAIDASGLNGGGSVNVGGGFQGKNDGIANAKSTFIDIESIIQAEAVNDGNGGEVVIWSNENTSFAGIISATGGIDGGDGGLVEVSGATLSYQGSVDTSAVLGETGWLLLDPVGIRVVSGAPTGRPTMGSDPILQLTDGTLNNVLSFNNILLLTSPASANILADPDGMLSGRGGTSLNDDNIIIEAGTSINTGSNILFFSTTTVDLFSDITGNVAGGLSSGVTIPIPLKDPTTVNVFGSGSGGTGSIQNAVDIVGVGGLVNVGAGTYAGFNISQADITVDGAGVTSIVNAASPAITIAADGVTIQDFLLQGTGTADEVGVLLDGTTAGNLTGAQIINVDFSNLDDGIRSQGDIGDGVAANIDVLVRGTSSASPSIFEDFLDAAIDVGDTDGDAVYLVQDVIVQDGNSDNVSTGDDGFRFGDIGGATIQRVNITEAAGDGVQFGTLDNAAVTISDSSIVGALDDTGSGNGLNFNGFIANGSQIEISGNSRIESLGNLHGILFNQGPTGVSTSIDIHNNTLIQSVENQGIVFARGATDVTVAIHGNGTNATNGIRGPSDAISVNNSILTNVNFLIGGDTTSDGNFISSTAQGLDIEGIDGGTFVVANNDLIQGSLAIEIEGDVTNGAEIIVVNNGDINSTSDGIEFQGNIATNVDVTITGNAFAETARDAVRFSAGRTINDATITIGSANVMVDGFAVGAGGNIMTGSANGSGINVSAAVQGDTNFNITDNTIGGVSARVGQDGIQFAGGILETATVQVGGTNQVFATGQAINVKDLQSPSTLSITGGTYNGTGGALQVDNTGVTGSDGLLNIDSASFVGGTGSTVFEVLTDVGNAGVDIDFTGSATIDGGATGMRLSGPGIDILNDTLGNMAFSNQTTNYIELADGAEFLPGSPTIIDAKSTTFDGLTGSQMTASQLFATEDMIVHFPDDNTLGLIDLSVLFVVQGESIQSAVNAAGLLSGPQIVAVDSGTYGGSVEVWVDDLRLFGRGSTTIIDTDAVDAFANNGDVNNGFQIAAISGTSGGGDVSGVIIDGFHFDTLTTTGSNIGIELGESGVSLASDATIENNSFNDLANGIVTNAVTGAVVIANSTTTNIAQRGIDFLPALGVDDTVVISDNNIASIGDAVRFDQNINQSNIVINGNTITAGDNGVYFGGEINNSRLFITDNDIEGMDDGVEFSDMVLGGSTIKINNNLRIQGISGFNVDGITFESPVTGTNTSVEIIGNTQVRGDARGIGFQGIVTDATVTISRNTEIRGDRIDGILFEETLTNANILIGGPSTVDGNILIIGGDEALDIEDIVGGSFTIANNGMLLGTTGDGIEFEDPISNAEINIVGNFEIRGAETGIIFEDVGTGVSDSTINIAGNTGVFGDGTDAILFQGLLTNSNVNIGPATVMLNGMPRVFGGNGQIIGAEDGFNIDQINGGSFSVTGNTLVRGIAGSGIEFDGTVSNSAVLTVAGNMEIRGGEEGIEFDTSVSDSTVTIAGNLNITGDTSTGIQIKELVNNSKIHIGTATVNINGTVMTFGGNRVIVGNEDGLEVSDISGGVFTVADNEGIFGGSLASSAGIEFEGVVNNGATISIVGNSRFGSTTNGLSFLEAISDSSITVAGNRSIFGGLKDAILFNSPLINTDVVIGPAMVIVDGTPIAFAGNRGIVGGDGGIRINEISGGSFTVAGSKHLLALDGFGIGFDKSISNSAVIIVADNKQINGFEGGIGFSSTVNDSKVTITSNEEISGGWTAGIHFGDAVNDTMVTIGGSDPTDGNNIFGVDAGIELLATLIGSQPFTIQGNTITVSSQFGTGILLNNLAGSLPVNIEDNVINDGAFGIVVHQIDGSGISGQIVIDRVVVNNPADTGLLFTNDNSTDSLLVTLQNNVTVNGGASAIDNGIVFDGLGLSLSGDSLSNTRLFDQNGNFIELRNGALFEPGRPTLIDGTEADFNGLNAELFNERLIIIQKIVDFLDDRTLGLIFPGGKALGAELTYDRFTRYEDYFRTISSLLEPYSGIINYPIPRVIIAAELEEQAQE